MTIVDFISAASIWLKIILILLALYIITWMPIVISRFNKIIKQLVLMNEQLDAIGKLLIDDVKQVNNVRILYDMMLKEKISNKENKEK